MAFKKGTTIFEAAPRPFVQCAYVGCGYEALVRSKGLNLCRVHYEAQGNKEAAEHAAKHGLKTPADHLAYIRKLMASPRPHPRAWMDNPKSEIARRFADEVRLKESAPKKERVPGEDDEPLGIPTDVLEKQFREAA